MRIDGTDAISFSPQKISTADSTTNASITNDTSSQKNTKTKETDARNYAMLSDMEKKELPISEKVVIDAIEKANKVISGANRKFEFSIHEKTKEIMVKVIDSDTNQVIREIPPEKILDMVAKMWEMAGLIVDERR